MEGSDAIILLGTMALRLRGSFRLTMLWQLGILRSSNAELSEVLSLLGQEMPTQLLPTERICFNNNILLEKISFRYAANLPDILMNLSLKIRRGERIGIIGPSGCGKSTAVDIIMGLLEPNSGRLLVDGVPIYQLNDDQNVVNWRREVAHVPQSIFLTDSSIAENIAFGIPYNKIDMEKVVYVSEMAQLDSFVKSLPNSYGTSVGERDEAKCGENKKLVLPALTKMQEY